MSTWETDKRSACRQYHHKRQVDKACANSPTLRSLTTSCPAPAKKMVSSGDVFSPVNARVVCIGDHSITLNIAETMSHDIFAPLSGRILAISGCQGKIWREELLLFKADPRKNARLSIRIQGDICVEFWLEVGKDWLPKEIFITHKKWKGSLLNKNVHVRDKLGKLKIGSLAEIHFPRGVSYDLCVRKGDIVQGGISPVVKWKR